LKSLIVLWKELANEFANWCCTSATFDCKTVERRIEHEGLSFLTITLPEFGKDFQKSLDRGQVDRDLFQGFSWRAGLPLFLGGFLDRVFDRSSGVLLDDPCIDSIFAVRQLALLYSKIALPCSDARIRRAMRGYIECEQDVREHDSALSAADKADFRRISSMLFSGVFSRSDTDVYYLDVLPKHGPGATADRLRGNGKYRQSTWPSRLEEVFPSGEFLLPNWRYYDQLDDVDILEPGAEIPVKVITVPKTLKTPRIIAIEPTAMQYAQQAVLASILDSLQKDDFLRTVIGFNDQTPNQRMALKGSIDGSLATLDLSEASDRVSNQHVREMLVNHPHLSGAVDASRSRKADVPGHGVIRLSKFASMGSALCFPFEAMVFTTLIFMGIERELSTSLSRGRIEAFKGKVRVYGDDIIIPVDYVPSVVRVLETFGYRVNSGKSFWTGKFRESCGRDYYAGHDVTPVKVRRSFPTQRKDAQEVISLVSLRNQLYERGCWQTVKWLDETITGVLRYFPVVLPTSPALGRHSYLGFETEKLCPNTHGPLVRAHRVISRLPQDHLEGPEALVKCLLMLERRKPDERGIDLPVDAGEHLERSGRPLAVNTKLGWVSSI